MAKNVRRRVAAPAPTATTPAPAPVLEASNPAPVVEQVAPVTPDMDVDPSIPQSLRDLLSNVNAKQADIAVAIAAIDQGSIRGYSDCLRASTLFGVTWDALAKTRPTPIGKPAHPSEQAFKTALDRADATTSPLVCDEIAELNRLAVWASKADVAEKARADAKNGKYVASRRPVKSEEMSTKARADLEAKLASYKGSNSGALLAYHADLAIKSIDNENELVRLAKELQLARVLSGQRRAVLTWLDLVKPTFEASIPEAKRGGEYRLLTLHCQAEWKDFMFNALKSGEPTAEDVKNHMLAKVGSYLGTLTGAERTEATEVSNTEWLTRLYALIGKCAKKGAISDAAATSAKSALASAGYKHPDAKDDAPATINGGGELTKTEKKVRAKAPDAPTVETPQPVKPPVAGNIPARGRAKVPAGPTADQARAALAS